MDNSESTTIQKKRDRKKRVQRIRTMIITVISVWMILSMILTAFMCVKMVSLQRQIDVLTGEGQTQGKVSNKSTGAQQEEGILVAKSIDEKDNLAQEGDVHKVYLTFDDGPSENTELILDILDDYGIKASFFVNGREDEASLASYKRIAEEGHTIAMHSYSHKYSEIYQSVDAFQKDFEKIQNLIYDTTGVECRYYRFPGGSSNGVSNTNMAEYVTFLEEQGVTYYDWNVSSGDATSKAFTAQELVENVMKDVVKYKTSVVLLHDAKTKQTTVEALPQLIEALQESGALILPIDENTKLIQHTSIQK